MRPHDNDSLQQKGIGLISVISLVALIVILGSVISKFTLMNQKYTNLKTTSKHIQSLVQTSFSYVYQLAQLNDYLSLSLEQSSQTNADYIDISSLIEPVLADTAFEYQAKLIHLSQIQLPIFDQTLRQQEYETSPNDLSVHLFEIIIQIRYQDIQTERIYGVSQFFSEQNILEDRPNCYASFADTMQPIPCYNQAQRIYSKQADI